MSLRPLHQYRPSFTNNGDIGAFVLCFLLLTFGCTLVGGAVLGWIFNLVAIAKGDEQIGMLVLRVIGIFLAPIGAVLGWIK